MMTMMMTMREQLIAQMKVRLEASQKSLSELEDEVRTKELLLDARCHEIEDLQAAIRILQSDIW